LKRFTYKTGEEIRAGDHVNLHGYPGQVEFVVNGPTGDPAMDWYVEEFGGGAMVKDEHIGGVFLSAENIEEDDGLLFVSRSEETSTSSG
jgi:hypothetical protein